MRTAAFVWMLAFLLWLPFEDTQIWVTAVLAVAGVGWLVFRRHPWDVTSGWGSALEGGLLGAAAPLFTIFLMAFKSGVHGHGFSDFSARQVWGLWSALPISLSLGLILGLGIKISANAKTPTTLNNLVNPSQSTGDKGSARPG